MLKPCSTLEEFVEKYDKDLERILAKSFKNYIEIDKLPEIKNDVYIHLLEKNFFTTYDPTKAQFSTYLYTYLFKFLKSKKIKEDKQVTRHALNIDQTVYKEGNATFLDVKEFNTGRNPIRNFEDEDLNNRIEETLEKRLSKLVIYNPYLEGSFYNFVWNLLLEPISIQKLIKKLDDFPVMENPYHRKRDSVKHEIWDIFKEVRTVRCSMENELWTNVSGIKHVVNPKLSREDKRILKWISKKTPCTYFELLLECPKISTLESLHNRGILDGLTDLILNDSPYYLFHRMENLAWHVVWYFQERHSELFEYANGKYYLNRDNAPFKLFRMLLNGKTNKEITTTYRVNTNAFQKVKKSIFRDIKKII